ncbi:DNA double-strand break repair nuclease NurA [Haloarchaeobius amylolyticus]|uniref:DNA double-strand break repair nuclease NurA n=1 Tax=Haloarchaeobius amylolyticus TaxID=1198296 RepID=UPI00226DCEF3|nr:DNA double-strand break repair nuclease NurA [Haloarchaeobius amylolyticus]
MTLDPVHFEGIAQLARRIRYDVGEDDHRDFARTVWAEFLDPLVDDGRTVLEPLGEQGRHSAPIEDVALTDEPFETVHGLDSGTINPTTFTNGLVLDIAQAAMSATPSDLELHRARTLVMTVHTNDRTVDVSESDWEMGDEGYIRSQIRQAPRVDRFAEGVVHALALYLAESKHALTQAEVVDDLLVLDGPLYPKGLFKWADRHPELAALLDEDDRVREVVSNYVELVERFVTRDVPLVGFVKNPATKVITRTVQKKGAHAPWVDDTAFFTRVLERGGFDPDTEQWERDTNHLTCTNWFASRGGADHPLSTDGDALGVERRLDDEDYEPTFCAIYDPRNDLVYRLEAPYAFTKDAATREDLRLFALQEIAARNGPPLAVAKADELARISRDEKRALTATLEETFEARRMRDYDDTRWD